MKTVYQTAIAVMAAAIGGEIALLNSENGANVYNVILLQVSATAFFASILGAYMLMQSVAEAEMIKAGMTQDQVLEALGLRANMLKRANRFLEQRVKWLSLLPFVFYYFGFLVAVFCFIFSY